MTNSTKQSKAFTKNYYKIAPKFSPSGNMVRIKKPRFNGNEIKVDDFID
jgi:hypothetical protein